MGKILDGISFAIERMSNRVGLRFLSHLSDKSIDRLEYTMLGHDRRAACPTCDQMLIVGVDAMRVLCVKCGSTLVVKEDHVE